MKLGLVTAILDGWKFEEMIDASAAAGYSCVEVACWPAGQSERRYAGVSHIDVTALDDAAVEHIKSYSAQKGVVLSALAYYPNPMDADLEKRAAAIEHLQQVIVAAGRLGVEVVTTFIGRDQTKTVEENLELYAKLWPPIVRLAEEQGVKLAIENCPMLFGADQWPGGQNLATTPAIWRRMFEIIPSKHLGINYDPSHFVWQMIDYIAPLYEFAQRIYHVHFKDIKLYRDRLNQVGVMGYPLDFMSPKLPGLGDVDWGAYCSALTDIGYDGAACVEVEDKAFEQSREKILDSIVLSARYMNQFVI